MKILMISLHADPATPAGIGEGGGTHSYVHELLNSFSSDDDIEILCITVRASIKLPLKECISLNCNLVRIVVNNEKAINKKELYHLRSITLEKIKESLNEMEFMPDLIHSIYWNSGQAAMQLSHELGIPYVHTVISNGLRRTHMGFNEPIKERFGVEKKVFNSATYIFCITDSEKQDLIELYGVCGTKIVVPGRPISDEFLYPAHDDFGIPYFKNLQETENVLSNTKKLDIEMQNVLVHTDDLNWTKKAFIFCGRMAANKGIDIVLKSWIKLKESMMDKCPPLWIVGGTPKEIQTLKCRINMMNRISKYESNGDVIWWGYLDQRGISTLFLKSLALIMHSKYEPGGRVVIEALSAGIPVISTKCGFGADYVHDWYDGFQVPYGNIDILYNILKLFVKQPYLSNYLGINARHYMREVLNEWNFVALHKNVYDDAHNRTGAVHEDFSLKISAVAKYKYYINTYPFFNNIISEGHLINILAENSTENYTIEPMRTSTEIAMWKFNIKNLDYEVFQPYTKMFKRIFLNQAVSPAFVDLRTDIFKRELLASDLYGINNITYANYNYFIFSKRGFSSVTYDNLLNTNTLKDIQSLFDLFIHNNGKKDIPDEVMNRDWQDSCSSIENALNSISSFLGGNERLSDDLKKLYDQCFQYFDNIFSEYRPTYGYCLGECTIENIRYDKSSRVWMFQSAATLYWGDTNRMAADFLYHLSLHQYRASKGLSLKKILADFSVNIYNIGWFLEICLEQSILGTITLRYQYHQDITYLLTQALEEIPSILSML